MIKRTKKMHSDTLDITVFTAALLLVMTMGGSVQASAGSAKHRNISRELHYWASLLLQFFLNFWALWSPSIPSSHWFCM